MSTTATTAADGAALLFAWDAPRRRGATIVVCLAGSFLAHVVCFYLFQIVYPPTVAILPPPVRVGLISPSTEEGRSLLRWVEAEDPALAFATQRPADARLRALPKLEHVPSYISNEPAIQQIPPLVSDLRMPSVQAAGPVRVAPEPKPAQPVPISTSVLFSEELAECGAPVFPPAQFTASNQEPPQSVRFRVAVDQRGAIRYSLPINSSGDPALDQQARQHLLLCRFNARSTIARREEMLTWGVATVEWGNDVAAPQATTPSR